MVLQKNNKKLGTRSFCRTFQKMHQFLGKCLKTCHFTEIHRSLLRKIEKILNKPITKFYNNDDVDTTTAELRQTKTRSISF